MQTGLCRVSFICNVDMIVESVVGQKQDKRVRPVFRAAGEDRAIGWHWRMESECYVVMETEGFIGQIVALISIAREMELVFREG